MTFFQGKYRIESARLRDWDYGSRGSYFVTICTRNRRCVFGRVVDGQMELSEIGKIASCELEDIPRHYDNVSVDEHVVMPNHVHAIIVIDGDHTFSLSPRAREVSSYRTTFSPAAGSLSAIIRSFKAGVTLRCRERGLAQFVWQSRFHDHLLRGDEVIGAVREYIWNNPGNWAADKENPLAIRA